MTELTKDMSDQLTLVEEMVSREMERFCAALPEFLATLRGRYVVFKDGTVQSHHETLSDAYAAGVNRFGLYGGMVITEVKAHRPLQVSPSVFFHYVKR